MWCDGGELARIGNGESIRFCMWPSRCKNSAASIQFRCDLWTIRCTLVCQLFCRVVKLSGIHVQMWRSQSWKRSWMRTLQTSFITQRCVFPQQCGESSRNTDNKSRYMYITGLKQTCIFHHFPRAHFANLDIDAWLLDARRMSAF